MKVMDRIARVTTMGFGPYPADAPVSPVLLRSMVVMKDE